MKKIFFRFDDVCVNANLSLIDKMTIFLLEKFPNSSVIHAISPLVHDMKHEKDNCEKQRVFPSILNALSDYKSFYKVDTAAIPKFNSKVIFASHGLIHVDHRLLPKAVQEISILISTSLLKSNIFVPPFNKWNKDTEDICNNNGIELIKFEDGWLNMKYNKFTSSHEKWYLHAREFKYKDFIKWFDNE